jgi:hypothetical protein
MRCEPLAIGARGDPALDADDAVPVAEFDLEGAGIEPTLPAMSQLGLCVISSQRAPASKLSVAAGSDTGSIGAARATASNCLASRDGLAKARLDI